MSSLSLVFFATVSQLTLSALGAATAPGSPTDVTPAALRNVDVVEKLGAQVPKDLRFVDSAGRAVRLGDYFDGEHPVILTLAYYHCPALCGLVLSGTAKSLLKTQFKLGPDYRALTVSVDPKDTADTAATMRRGITAPMVKKRGDEAGWEFLAAPDESAARALSEAVGFQYSYDKETGQYAHPAAAFILTPEGKVSRYFYGVEFSPRDLRLALVEASAGKAGTSFDRVLLTCFKFDPATQKYGFYLSTFLRVGSLAVFLALATTLSVLWRREIKKGTVL